MSQRRWSLVTFAVAAVAFVVIAAWRIPWHPVPGGTPPPVSEAQVFTSAEIARANAYSDPARMLAWASLAVSLVVALVLGLTPLGARLAGRLRGWWWVRVLLAVAALAVIGRLVTLPFAIIGHHRSLDYGLSTEAWGPWTVDLLKGLLLSIVISGLLLLVLIGCARRWPRAWPAVAGTILGALVMVGSFVYPVVVEPAFNQFTPLQDGPLRAQILHLADVEHVHLDDVLVADASRRTTTLNAYVSGYGSTRRVVIYDNVIKDLPRAQILSIVAHELGHARHDDVLTGSVLAALGTTLGIGLLGLVLSFVRRVPGGMRDPTVVPLVLALVAIATLLSSPVNNGLSRLIETRADVDSLEATRDPAAFVKMQRELDIHSLSDNGPTWSHVWFGSHPTTLERIAIAEQLGRRMGVTSDAAPGG
ncbi:MAG TPA: M48 family metallopeptidase [Nocardioides sp.]|uniref:M48 family metallopeptidase n=1 Tax=Nocardioides sp. TaxID=35761 RepID=UPI002F420B22